MKNPMNLNNPEAWLLELIPEPLQTNAGDGFSYLSPQLSIQPGEALKAYPFLGEYLKKNLLDLIPDHQPETDPNPINFIRFQLDESDKSQNLEAYSILDRKPGRHWYARADRFPERW